MNAENIRLDTHITTFQCTYDAAYEEIYQTSYNISFVFDLDEEEVSDLDNSSDIFTPTGFA